MQLTLATFTRVDLAVVEPWFADEDTRRFLGGPDWPAAMLEHADRAVGTEFRGALQTGARRYLARIGARPVGYIDCGIFDRCTVYGGEGPDGPVVTDAVEAVTGAFAFVVDPAARRHGYGRAMISALVGHSDLRPVELFEAGVEPDNTASRRCLQAAGFELRTTQPDFEGMLYYQRARVQR
jgi:RimJ/RimL family protein N-acetyltransferase